MQIIRAKPDDAPGLTEIAFAAKRHWGYPEHWMEHWHEALTITPEAILKHEFYAAIVDGRIAGFHALARKEHRLELLHLWVLPQAMGGGVGRSLFLHAVERTKALGFRELEIESDPNAQGFYVHLGARRVGSSIRELENQTVSCPSLFTKSAVVLALAPPLHPMKPNAPDMIRRPLGVTLLACFFGFGTLASGLAILSLLFPGGPLEPAWRINPRGHEAFTRMGGWAFVLLVPACFACAATAYALFRGARWGYWLAVALLLANLIGDVVNAALDIELRAAVGVPVVVLLLLYLRSSTVREFFSTTH